MFCNQYFVILLPKEPPCPVNYMYVIKGNAFLHTHLVFCWSLQYGPPFLDLGSRTHARRSALPESFHLNCIFSRSFALTAVTHLLDTAVFLSLLKRPRIKGYTFDNVGYFSPESSLVTASNGTRQRRYCYYRTLIYLPLIPRRLQTSLSLTGASNSSRGIFKNNEITFQNMFPILYFLWPHVSVTKNRIGRNQSTIEIKAPILNRHEERY